MKFTFIFLFLFGVSLICLVEGNPPDAPKPPKYDEDDEEALDEEEDEEGDGEEDDEDGEDDEYGDEYELEEGAEEDEYPEDEPPTTQPPTTTQTTTTTTISTTTQPTTTTTKQTTTTTMPTTTSTTTTKPTTTTSTTTTTQDPRKTLASRVMILLNNFSELQTTVNSATVQDQSCKEKISSSLVAYLAAGLKLEDSIYKESYSKGLDSLNKLEGELKEVKKDWNECLIRTTTTTTTEKPTTTTESTTEAPTTTKTEERRLKEFIPEFTIDPPKQEYAQEPNSAQDEEINKQLMEEIKRAEDMIEKQKQAINDPTLPLPPIEELADERETKKNEEKTTKVEETTTKVEETTTILETTTQEVTTTTTTTKKPTQPQTTKKPPTTTTIKKIVTTQAPPTTVAYVYKHINHKFKSLKSTKDKAPAICNDSLDLYSGPRYAKSVCVINRNVNYNDAHELCVKEEMDLFAIQTVDHHLACRLKTQELFENVGSFWINGRYINDLWYYFSSENNFVKRFIYPGTQFDGSHTGNCLRLMKFGDHVAANAANCDLELPVFCEYYIQ